VTTALSRPPRLSLEAFSRAVGLHPDLVVRFVRLGLIEADRDASGALFFAPREIARTARIQRLHTGLSLNYAALGLVVDLLDRIAVLEAALRHRPTPHGGSDRQWT
jgi:chaperone modulatory protein CbpM